MAGEDERPAFCREVCEEAADLAVKKLFAMLGVDVDDPRQVENFRQDLGWGSRMRRRSDEIGAVTIGTIVVAILGLIGAIITAGVVVMIDKIQS